MEFLLVFAALTEFCERLFFVPFQPGQFITGKVCWGSGEGQRGRRKFAFKNEARAGDVEIGRHYDQVCDAVAFQNRSAKTGIFNGV